MTDQASEEIQLTPPIEPSARIAPSTRHWIALGVICLATLIFAVDVTVLQIANANIQLALGFQPADLQWIFTAYALTFGGLLLLGGRAGDFFGHRRLFIGGMAAFGVASLAASLAQSPAELIASRALQGAAAAAAAPSALALIAATVPEGTARHKAYALWGVAGSAGGAIGYFLGGIIVGAYGWRWAFLINLPIAVLTVAGGVIALPRRHERPADQSMDILGAVTSTGAIALLVYGLTQTTEGWTSTATLLSLAGSVVLAVVFVVAERTSSAPLVPARLLRPQAMWACLVALLMSAVVGSTIFYCSLFLQQDLGFSAGKAGISTFGVPVGVAIGSRIAPRLLRSLAARTVVLIGLVLLTLGVGWMALTLPQDSYAITFLPGWSLLGVGLAIAAVPMLSLATDGVPPGDRGTMAAIYSVAGQIGGVIGLAVLSTIGAQVSGAHAETTSSHGIRVVLICAAGICVATCLVAAIFLPRKRSVAGEHPPVPVPEADIVP